MKKILLMVCAASVLMLTACKKDNEEPTPGGDTPQPEEVSGDGVYRPSQRISGIESDTAAPQVWLWENGDLQSTNELYNGAYLTLSSFSYLNHRLAAMETTIQGMPVQVGYVYNGEKLTNVSASSSGFEVIDMTVEHNASDKISRLRGSVDESLLGLLSQFLGDGGFGGFFKKALGSKVTLGSMSIDATMQWDGDNVTRRLLTASVTGSITMGELRQMVNLDSLAGSLSGMLALIGDSTVLPLTLTMGDTCTYTYDNHHNPFCGYLGELNAANLSANNVTSKTTSAGVSVTLTLQTVMGSIPIPFSYPMNSSNVSYTYTYDNAGYPLTVVDNEGHGTQYTYLQ